MVKEITKRKRRVDRKHIVYGLHCVVTGEWYVGITVFDRTANRSMKIRWQKHVRRALTENKDWTLCRAIRAAGPEAFVPLVIDVVRGKPTAHAIERQLIAEVSPTLNTQ